MWLGSQCRDLTSVNPPHNLLHVARYGGAQDRSDRAPGADDHLTETVLDPGASCAQEPAADNGGDTGQDPGLTGENAQCKLDELPRSGRPEGPG